MTDLDAHEAFGDPGGERWRLLVARLGGEIAVPLTAALDRVQVLSATGKIDRNNLRALRDELERARQIGMIGQQLARFGSGRLRQSHERIDLTQTLRSVLKQRARDLEARDLEIVSLLQPSEVVADPSLLFVLFTSLLDWAAASADKQIELRVEASARPAQAQLTCRFAHAPNELAAEEAAGIHSLTWQLVQQTAWTMGLQMVSSDERDHTTLSIDFPALSAPGMPGVSANELAPAAQARMLAGHQVLVLAASREVHGDVLAALRHSGVIIDFVQTVIDAVQFCRDGLPHAVIYESAFSEELTARLSPELDAVTPKVALIEIGESEGDALDSSCGAGTRLDRAAILASLRSALFVELSKGK